MASDTIEVCEYQADFAVIGQPGEVGVCLRHLVDAILFASPCMVVFDQDPIRICGVNRTFPAFQNLPEV